MSLFRRKQPLHPWPETTRAPTEFVGVTPGSAELPYEFDTVDGVPVRLHDMSFVDLGCRVRPTTLTLTSCYDDRRWPPEAASTPCAALECDGAQVWQWEDEHDLLRTRVEARVDVRSLDWYAATNPFGSLTTGTRVLSAADRMTVRREADQPL